MELPEYVSAPERRRRLDAVLGAVVTLLLLVGVIAVVAEPSTDEARPATDGELAMLMSAASEAEAVKSARVIFRIDMDAQGRRFTTELDGAFGASGEGSFTVKLPEEVSQLGVPRTIEMVSDGPTTYMRLPEERRAMFGGKGWLQAPTPASGALEQTGVAPQSALEFLHRDSIEGSVVTRDADREVRGESTQQYRVVIDLDKLAERQPARAATLAALPPGSSREMPVRAFIGDDGLVRRLEIDYRTDGFKMQMTYEMFGIGTPVKVELPKAEDSVPVADLQAMFSALGLPSTGFASATPAG